MSVVVSTSEQISNSPINNSKSKQMFSFPKSKRFLFLPSRNRFALTLHKDIELTKYMTCHQQETAEQLLWDTAVVLNLQLRIEVLHLILIRLTLTFPI